MRNGLYCHNQLSDHFPALSYGIKTSHGATAPRRKKIDLGARTPQ